MEWVGMSWTWSNVLGGLGLIVWNLFECVGTGWDGFEEVCRVEWVGTLE